MGTPLSLPICTSNNDLHMCECGKRWNPFSLIQAPLLRFFSYSSSVQGDVIFSVNPAITLKPANSLQFIIKFQYWK